METLRDIFNPEFALRNSVYISLLVGFGCPLVGVYLILRRLVFLGVALPQISSAGIALAFALPSIGLLGHSHLAHFEGDQRVLALVGALGLSFGTILLLAFLERRGRGLPEGRIGVAYALAGASSILLLARNPIGERGLLDLLKGEIIAVSNVDLILSLVAFGIVTITLVVFKKEFLLVCYDRDMAEILKKKVLFWDSLLFLLIGLATSMAVLSVGPLVTFGFLLLPPLIAQIFARNMRQFSLIACSIGGVCAFCGFCLAYAMDLPVGPTDVALLGTLYGLAFTARQLWSRMRRA
jgi:ABC-type Mn2+/Zn2+ transport system permease subunit